MFRDLRRFVGVLPCSSALREVPPPPVALGSVLSFLDVSVSLVLSVSGDVSVVPEASFRRRCDRRSSPSKSCSSGRLLTIRINSRSSFADSWLRCCSTTAIPCWARKFLNSSRMGFRRRFNPCDRPGPPLRSVLFVVRYWMSSGISTIPNNLAPNRPVEKPNSSVLIALPYVQSRTP